MREQLTALRNEMSRNGIDLYLIPTGDFHGSEYLHDYFKTREYISGFTGSAGTLVVTKDEARLWTDGRYFLQGAMELADTGIDLMKDKEPGVPSITEYINDILKKLSHPVIGFDGRVVSCESGRSFATLAEEFNGSVLCNVDLAGAVWTNRPVLKGSNIWQLPLDSAGLPFEAKIKEVRSLMEKAGADYHLITTLDDNAWLYNLRGSDVARTPVFFSYTLITPADVILYIFSGNCSSDIIPEGIKVKEYFNPGEDKLSIMEDLEKLPSGCKILVDVKTSPYSIIAAIPEDVDLIETDYIPTSRLKACKNPAEIESTKAAHINDGVAMVNFIHWIKEAMSNNSDQTEISASDYLEKERASLPGFLDLSFDTISGYMDHGAIVHYGATEETNASLRPEGFLLVDSGGQYETGTTDITRTIALGPLTQKMKECYTVVLKGHAQLAMAKFKDGTTGMELDKLAKAPLDAYGISFNHGTGHGVGHVLCVHEGPQRINTISQEPIIPGMITSNEPGYYLEGEFGIRIENEILCVMDSDASGSKEGEKIYSFQNLTCCPYERDAIIKEMLTPEEIAYIDDYHSWVYNSLESKISPQASKWLKEVCQPL